MKIIDFGDAFVVAEKVSAITKEDDTKITIYADGIRNGMIVNHSSSEQRDAVYNDIKKCINDLR